MASITVRNLFKEAHRALRVRAAMAGRSIEAKIRFILEGAARPQGRVKLGSLLAEIGQEVRGFGLDIDLNMERDKTLTEPTSFE